MPDETLAQSPTGGAAGSAETSPAPDPSTTEKTATDPTASSAMTDTGVGPDGPSDPNDPNTTPGG